MDTTRLRYFCVVADTGSIRKAAGMLYLSPAALSKAIKVLEGELGTTLLRAEGRGIALTDTGRALANRARPLLAELATIPDELSTRQRGWRPLRFGSHEVFGTYFTRVLLAADPTLTFEHRYLVPGRIEQALLEHEIDLGISYIPVPTEGTESREVVRVRMGIYGLERLADVPFADLQFAAPALPTVGAAARPQGLDGWPDDRIPRSVPWRVTHTETALELCRAGRAVAYFPAFVVSLHNEHAAAAHRLVELPPPPELEAHAQPVHIVVRRSELPTHIDAVERALTQLATLT